MTNIPRPTVALTVSVEKDKPKPPEATRLDSTIEAQPVASTSWPSEATYLLSSAIKSRLVRTDLTRIKTLFGIPNEYQLRLANPKE